MIDDNLAIVVCSIFCALVGALLLIPKFSGKGSKEGSVTITLPDWAVKDYNKFASRSFKTDEDCMSLAIELSARNVAAKTGGPFGTAIFECDKKTGKRTLYAVGTNRVVPLGNSTLHGEMVAIQFAQAKMGTFSLNQGDSSNKQYELFTSASPCAQCIGGCLWSGVCKVVAGASKKDVETIVGFNEGPVYDESYEYLRRSGVEVKLGMLRTEASKVLKTYSETGVVYNR